MKKVIALGGSNSKNSINKALAGYAANQLNEVEVVLLDLNDFELPMYGIDHEMTHGIPPDATRMTDLIADADGLVVSLAEHNGSYAAAFKNAFDWMSRVGKEVWQNKPMLLMATSPGGRGGATVLNAAATSFPHLGGNIVGRFSLPAFNANFRESGIADDALAAEFRTQIEALQAAIDG